MELKTIGGHIRKRRLDLGLLQKEVALRISVDKSTVMNCIIAQEPRPASTGGREHALALGDRTPLPTGRTPQANPGASWWL